MSSDRPTLPDEIEITPEMIEAGVDALYENTLELWGPSSEELRSGLKEAFSAMLKARPEYQRANRTHVSEDL